MKKTWRVAFGKPSPGWRKRRILLPLEADRDNWSRNTRRMFRFVMRRRGWTWLGSRVRRKMRNSNRWSQHSWPGNAHDFAPPKTDRKGKRLTVRQRQRRGDNVVRLLRIRFGRKWLSIWNQPGARALHRSGNPMHIHEEHKPQKQGTPPR